MVKLAALVLLLANVLFFAWHQGHLTGFGFAPQQQREPERANQQLRPEALKILTADEVKKLEAAAAKPPECAVSPALEPAKADALRNGLATLVGPSGWALETQNEPARWIAYMGKYLNAEAQAKKKAELRALGVSVESVRRADLEPGISLGGGPTKADADKMLADAGKKGVRTGRVLEEKPAVQSQRLRMAAVDDAQRAKWPDIKALGGFAQFERCK